MSKQKGIHKKIILFMYDKMKKESLYIDLYENLDVPEMKSLIYKWRTKISKRTGLPQNLFSVKSLKPFKNTWITTSTTVEYLFTQKKIDEMPRYSKIYGD